ncbi:MAG: peptidoglycan-binding protein, partial [Eubacteriales bacterium]|nr:peptidoglycan-binding protein [Eubacteriales bacterium]
MIKKWLSVILCLSFLCAALPASAHNVLPVSEELVLHIGANGQVVDQSGAYRTSLPAQEILWANESRVIYLNKTADGALRMLGEYSGSRVNIYAGSVAMAVYSEAADLIYYTKTDDPTVLYRCSPLYGVSMRACVLPQQIVQLIPSLDGLIVLCQSETGEIAPWLLAKGESDVVLSDVVQEHRFEGCSVQVLLDGGMRIRFLGMEGFEQNVAATPIALTMAGNELFFLKNAVWNNAVQIYRYRTDEARQMLLTTLKTPVHNAIASDGSYVYLISTAGRLMVLDAQYGTQALSVVLPAVPVAPEMHLINNTLYIYDLREDGSSYLLASYRVERGDADEGIVDSETTPAPLQPVATPTPVPTPTPEPTEAPILLRRGMKGEEVRKMQTALKELGYLTDRADGDFGGNTLRAVKLFQEAVGHEETGMANNELLHLLYADDAPVFDLYAPLSRGDRGLRVYDLQSELYEKGYLAETPDSSYGSNTTAAVQRLQKELGLRQTGSMSSTCMEYVYNGRMPYCTSYFLLQRGDSGIRVEKLQLRLQDLGYYHGKISGTYDNATANAVILFETTCDASATGKASANLQKFLFSASAPVYEEPDPTPTPEPTPTPTPAPTPDPNVIGPDSPYEQVIALQRKLHTLGKISAGDVTGTYNKATKYAIGYIQIDMRDNYGYDVKSDGRAGLQTQAFIDYLISTITPAPVVTPTPVPV